MTRTQGLASQRRGSMGSVTALCQKRRKSTREERWRYIQLSAADVVELVTAGIASQWMTTFLFRRHPDDYTLTRADGKGETVAAVRTSLWHLYAACFVFGCSTTSFLQRRKAIDGLQIYVFATFVGAGLLVGQLRGASTEAIMLSYVSWAVCVAMLASVASYHIRRINFHNGEGTCRHISET